MELWYTGEASSTTCSKRQYGMVGRLDTAAQPLLASTNMHSSRARKEVLSVLHRADVTLGTNFVALCEAAEAMVMRKAEPQGKALCSAEVIYSRNGLGAAGEGDPCIMQWLNYGSGSGKVPLLGDTACAMVHAATLGFTYAECKSGARKNGQQNRQEQWDALQGVNPQCDAARANLRRAEKSYAAYAELFGPAQRDGSRVLHAQNKLGRRVALRPFELAFQP